MRNRNARGLCAGCAHAQLQRGKRGSEFLRCARADRDPHYLRYPPLPVLECRGFESGLGGEDGTAPDPRGSGARSAAEGTKGGD